MVRRLLLLYTFFGNSHIDKASIMVLTFWGVCAATGWCKLNFKKAYLAAVLFWQFLSTSLNLPVSKQLDWLQIREFNTLSRRRLPCFYALHLRSTVQSFRQLLCRQKVQLLFLVLHSYPLRMLGCGFSSRHYVLVSVGARFHRHYWLPLAGSMG